MSWCASARTTLARERAAPAVERLAGRCGCELPNLVPAGGDDAKRDLGGGCEPLDGPSVDEREGRRERVVPRDRVRQRALQHLRVERALELEGNRHVVERRARMELLVEPQLLLREREGDGARLACGGDRHRQAPPAATSSPRRARRPAGGPRRLRPSAPPPPPRSRRTRSRA